MPQIKVLIVDDSPLFRSICGSVLSADPEIRVVGEAENGKQAIEMVKSLKPDIVTMDMLMPVMNGLEAVEIIMSTNPVPILVITGNEDSETAFTALSSGALEVMAKADIEKDTGAEVINKIRYLSRVKVVTRSAGRHAKGRESVPMSADSVIAIASSTGGPKALASLLAHLPKGFHFPIVVAQHISDGFIQDMVKWLKSISKINIKIGSEGELIAAGTAYFSPSDRNMKIKNNGTIGLVEQHPKEIYHPSCDFLLSSVAEFYGRNCTGVILTGMGYDGAAGMRKIKDAGGATIAQDEASSIIFGMPKVAIENGCIDKVLPLNEIGRELLKMNKPALRKHN